MVFEVALFIPETFEEKVPFKFNPKTVQWNLQGIDQHLNLLIESKPGGIAKKLITRLEIAKISKSRKDLLLGLSLVNNANHYENHIQSLIAIKWITMTVPDKPTSPYQKNLTTLKGRLVL